MSKKIIIEAEDAEVKKVEKNIHKYSYHHLVDNKVVEWLIYMIGYAIVLITVSKLFQSFTINTSHFGIYAFLVPVRKTRWVISNLHFEDEDFVRNEYLRGFDGASC